MSQITQFLKLLAVTAGFAGLIWAQAETGQITGTVLDPAGAVIPGAKVVITSTATGAERTTVSTGAGAYTVTNLLPSEYDVKVQASGFEDFEQKVILTVGARVGLDAKMRVGSASTTVQVTESAVQVNTESQTLSSVVSQEQIRELPTLTRNPYALVATSGNVSDASPGMRGVGFNINGQRDDSTNVLLDGAANNDEFNAGIGQSVPLDSVQEFSVLTNNFTAEFGRATGGVVNVVTKSGTNAFHGTAYEFNRVSDLSSNTFYNNANGIPTSVFTRNQFGYSFGGPIIKDKLFFFSSTEWLRIRSAATETAVVLDPSFVSQTASGVQAFMGDYGKLKSNDSVLSTYTGASLDCGGNAACSAYTAAHPNQAIFDRVSYVTNADAGGGAPENGYQTVERVDYNMSDKTQIYGRYALQADNLFAGYASASPYQGYDTGQTDFNNNALVSVTRTITPELVSQTKAVFNRLNTLQPFGAAGGNIPTLFTGSAGVTTLDGVSVLFPGYNPGTPGSSIPFGGPQNFIQLYQDFSWTHGKHSFRFGGSYDYERDNRTFGAYEDGGYYLDKGTGDVGSAIAGLLSGDAYEFQAAIYPQGKLPGETVTFPLTQPNFSRSNRYQEGAVYAQDSWKVDPRFVLNIGVRWEHFGVQHNKNANLDSNFYDPADQIDTPLGIRDGAVYTVPNSPEGSLWKPDYHDFAPRLGFAWDVTGDQKTSLRGGYGISYERNFGNVTFNAIQNPPNYETVQLLSVNQTTPILISPANYGPFSATSGTVTLPRASLRNIDYNIQTAYAHTWDVSLEHQFGSGFVLGADYSGSRGVHLYDISLLNRPGYGNYFLGDPCTAAAGDCTSNLNPQYNGVNRRGSGGFSLYNAANVHAKISNLAHSGVTMTATYTWAHAIDDLSSTFSDANCYSTNNGCFNTGYLDPYDRMLDKGSSDFDIRHRLYVSAIWALPVFKNGKGIAHQVLGGWELAPLYEVRSGTPYSIFDGSQAEYDYVRAEFTAPVSNGTNSNAQPTSAPDIFSYLSFPDSIVDHFTNPKYGYSDIPGFPSGMTGRNTFRGPGYWDLDLGAYKSFSLTERFNLQFRAEAYNMFNHANMAVIGDSADASNVDPTDGGTSYVQSCKGCGAYGTYDRRNVQLALKLTF